MIVLLRIVVRVKGVFTAILLKLINVEYWHRNRGLLIPYEIFHNDHKALPFLYGKLLSLHKYG